jgi:hypothetical protein
MKKITFVLFLLLALTGGLFAQNDTGYVKPTLSLGFTRVSQEGFNDTLTTLSLDVDFVNAIGLTFGLQTIMAWSRDFPSLPLNAFGIGYTHNFDTWNIGGKIMAVPFVEQGFGIDVNGTYWFNKTIGLTGIIDCYIGFGSIDWTLISLRIGVSSRL